MMRQPTISADMVVIPFGTNAVLVSSQRELKLLADSIERPILITQSAKLYFEGVEKMVETGIDDKTMLVLNQSVAYLWSDKTKGRKSRATSTKRAARASTRRNRKR